MFSGLQHTPNIPGSRCAGGRICAGSRTGASADHGGDTVRDGGIDLLRRNKVDMTVNATGCYDQVLARNDFCTGSHNQLRIDTLHGVRIASFANFHDTAIPDANIAFDNSPVIDD